MLLGMRGSMGADAPGVVPVEYVERDFASETLEDARAVDEAFTMDISEAGFYRGRPDFTVSCEFSAEREVSDTYSYAFAYLMYGPEQTSYMYSACLHFNPTLSTRYYVRPYSNPSNLRTALLYDVADEDSLDNVRSFYCRHEVLSDGSGLFTARLTGAADTTMEVPSDRLDAVYPLASLTLASATTQSTSYDANRSPAKVKLRLRGLTVASNDGAHGYSFEPVRAPDGVGFRETNSGLLLVVDAPSVSAGPDL